MEKSYSKANYSTPVTEVLNVKVEVGMQTSGTPDNSRGANTTQYGTGSWDDPTPGNAPQYT